MATPAASAATQPALGFYAPSGAARNTALQEIGGHAAILNSFYDWPASFPADFVTQAESIGAIPMITWEPTGASLTAIAGGKRDGYLKSWAAAANSTGTTIYIRFAHEMNGRWFPWGYGTNGNTPAEYVAAWRHVVNVFRAVGALKVKWVWCIATSGDQTVIQSLYPGDSYVNWVAMDGYNRDKKGVWRTFGDIFTADYDVLRSMTSLPIMIAETASVEDPANATHKAGWIEDAFLTEIPSYYPRIHAVLYFDSGGNNYSYPWDSSSAALSAMKSVFASSTYKT